MCCSLQQLIHLFLDNIFQQGSRLSLPFPPLPESLATRQGVTPIQSHLKEALSRPDFGAWYLAQQGSDTVSHSWGTNTVSSSRSINTNSSSHTRPVATTRQQPALTTSTAATHHQPTLRQHTPRHQRAPRHQQQAVPQTQSASVMHNTRTISSNLPNNRLSFDSDSMYLSDSSDSDISDIRAEPTPFQAQVSIAIRFFIFT